jgi:hypothetical protein
MITISSGARSGVGDADRSRRSIEDIEWRDEIFAWRR